MISEGCNPVKKVELKIINSLNKILVGDRLDNYLQKATALRNERFHFQIVLKGNETVDNLSLTVNGDVQGLSFYDVKDILGGPSWVKFKDDYFEAKDKRLYPDLLIEHEDAFSIKKDEIKSIFVAVDCSQLSKGVHKWIFEIAGESTEFELNVLPCKLVDTNLILTDWVHIDCICDVHNVEPFTKEFYSVFEQYLALYVQMGNNTILTPLFTPPLDVDVGSHRKTVQLISVQEINGQYAFDFSKLSYFMQFCMKRGIANFEFSQLFTQWGAKACPKIAIQTQKGEEIRFGWSTASDDEEYLRFLSACLTDLAQFLRLMQLDGKVFFHISDEPTIEDFDRYSRLATFVKSHIGDMKILDTITDKNFLQSGLMNIPAIATREWDFITREKVSSMIYYCCVEHENYLSNRFFCMPLQRTRILGMQLYANNSIGFLHWGFNFYYSYHSQRKIDPYTETDAGGYYPSGDAFVVYPTGNGATPSIRYMTMIEAFQDYRALKTLEFFVGRGQVMALLEEEGVRGLTEYPHCAEWHFAFRQKINDLIKNKFH